LSESERLREARRKIYDGSRALVSSTMQVIENESTDFRAAARSSAHVVGSDSSSARREPAGSVERAFASVRIVDANVCAGGEWLVPPKVRWQAVGSACPTVLMND